MTIRVLIVDDSGVVRANLAHVLNSVPEIEVIGSVASGEKAIAFVKQQKPDVITMDIQMAGIDGFEATRRIMESTPVPIIIVSSYDPKGQENAFKALEAGAVACIATPPGFGHPRHEEAAAELISVVKQMSEVKVVRRWAKREPSAVMSFPTPNKRQIKLVALGASTGGPPAVCVFLSQLPADFPVPILIVQHIAKGFTNGLVEWLNNSSPLPVCQATHLETLQKGRVYIAPDEMQMGVERGGKIVLRSDAPEHSLRPSVSYLFRSVAETYGSSAAGVLLTGMGTDGAAELKMLKDAGGITFVQDKITSVVHGMPGEAIRLGAADHVLPPEGIAAALVRMILPEQVSTSKNKCGEKMCCGVPVPAQDK